MARAIRGPRAGGSTSSMSRRPAVVNNSQRTRELNDDLRQHLLGSFAVMTPGVSSAPNDLPEPRRQDETHRTCDLGHSPDGPSSIDLAENRVDTRNHGSCGWSQPT